MTTERIKILHLDFCGSGILLHVLSIIDNGDPDRFEHIVVHANGSLGGLDQYPGALHARGVRAVSIDVRRELNLRDIAVFARVRRLIREVRPDVVHCHSTKAGLFGRLAAFLEARTPTVFTPHAFSFFMSRRGSPKYRLYSALERFLGNLTNRLITISRSEFDMAVLEKIGRPERRLLIPIGIDVDSLDKARVARWDTRKELGLDPSETVLCSIGRLAPQKMPLLLIEALRRVCDRGKSPTLLIIGDGPLEADVRALVKERNLGDRVRFLGWQPHASAMGYLAASDMMLLPSRYEGMPAVSLEAQALGCVPIVTNVPGSRDTVIDGESGLIVPFDDVEALADAVVRVIDDPSLQEKLARGGRSQVIENFHVKTMVRRIEDAYLAAAGRDVVDRPDATPELV